MKLLVQHVDGAQERITLVPPVEVHLGTTLNHLRDGAGMEYWFTDDGYYDGWGKSVAAGEDPQDVIARMESAKEIEPR